MDHGKKKMMMGGKMKVKKKPMMMKKGGKFPDLTGDGKVTRADVLKGRGVFKGGGKMKMYKKGGMAGLSGHRNKCIVEV